MFHIGKMLILAAMFSCIDPIFSIAANLSFKDPFYCPIEKEDEANAKKFAFGLKQYSDHIAFSEALRCFETKNYRESVTSFCWKNFLSFNTLKLLSEMKTQFAAYLFEMKFLENNNPKDHKANRNSRNLSVIKFIVCTGLYPNIAVQ
jgi:ATP-dependent RNA helicase DHX36